MTASPPSPAFTPAPDSAKLPALRTPRLLLRAPRPTDGAPLAAILQEPAVARYWPGYDAQRVQAELLSASTVTVLTIELADDAAPESGQVIGALQYEQELDPDYRQAAIDVFLSARVHGRGLGSEAIRAAVEHLFATLGHHRIVIDPAADNQRAIRAYAGLGFRQVGLLRQYERGPDGTFHDCLLMELLATDYRGAAPLTGPAAPTAVACTVRPATAADVPALLALMVDFNRWEGIAWDPEHGEAPLRHLLGAPELGQVTLFQRAETAVGYALITYGYDLEFGGRDAFLTEMYLTPAARGQGLGQKLLGELLVVTGAAAVQALHLQVRPDNIAAQRLYRAAGFAPTTRLFLSRRLSVR